MGMTWTEEQKKVIDLRDRNILVSAAGIRKNSSAGTENPWKNTG